MPVKNNKFVCPKCNKEFETAPEGSQIKCKYLANGTIMVTDMLACNECYGMEPEDGIDAVIVF